jgi:hypothetical protein
MFGDRTEPSKLGFSGQCGYWGWQGTGEAVKGGS